MARHALAMVSKQTHNPLYFVHLSMWIIPYKLKRALRGLLFNRKCSPAAVCCCVHYIVIFWTQQDSKKSRRTDVQGRTETTIRPWRCGPESKYLKNRLCGVWCIFRPLSPKAFKAFWCILGPQKTPNDPNTKRPTVHYALYARWSVRPCTTCELLCKRFVAAAHG